MLQVLSSAKNCTLLFAVLLFVSFQVSASPLSDAKASGLIGEMTTGYLGSPLSKVPADIETLINDINHKRKQKYKSIADHNKISLASVEELAAKKAMEKTLAGQWINLGGGWTKK